jgi:hypothetical protein
MRKFLEGVVKSCMINESPKITNIYTFLGDYVLFQNCGHACDLSHADSVIMD